jgi:hypothetical protein
VLPPLPERCPDRPFSEGEPTASFASPVTIGPHFLDSSSAENLHGARRGELPPFDRLTAIGCSSKASQDESALSKRRDSVGTVKLGRPACPSSPLEREGATAVVAPSQATP